MNSNRLPSQTQLTLDRVANGIFCMNEDYSRGGVSSDCSDFSDFSVSSEERKTGRREDSIFWCRRPKRLWDLLPPSYR